jgi:hypothetical protein
MSDHINATPTVPQRFIVVSGMGQVVDLGEFQSDRSAVAEFVAREFEFSGSSRILYDEKDARTLLYRLKQILEPPKKCEILSLDALLLKCGCKREFRRLVDASSQPPNEPLAYRCVGGSGDDGYIDEIELASYVFDQEMIIAMIEAITDEIIDLRHGAYQDGNGGEAQINVYADRIEVTPSYNDLIEGVRYEYR